MRNAHSALGTPKYLPLKLSHKVINLTRDFRSDVLAYHEEYIF